MAPVNATLPAARPISPVGVGAAFDDAIATAQAEIAASVERAGLRDDPYRYPLAALSTALGLFPAFLQRMEVAAERARLPACEAELKQLEQAAAAGAARQADKMARAAVQRNTLLSAAVLTGSVLLTGTVAGVIGYNYGRASMAAAVHETEAGLTAAFHDGSDSAANWLRLMQLNDLPGVMRACAGERAFTDPSGRHACLAPLWLESPRAESPGSAGR